MGLEPHSLAREVAVGTGAGLEWTALSLFEGGLASPLDTSLLPPMMEIHFGGVLPRHPLVVASSPMMSACDLERVKRLVLDAHIFTGRICQRMTTCVNGC
jgi:hypothetical protein